MSAVLEYMADTSIPVEAKYKLAVAKNKAEFIKNTLIDGGTGGAEIRKARAMVAPEYQDALSLVALAQRAVDEDERRSEYSKMLFEAWRTENANVRAAERVR